MARLVKSLSLAIQARFQQRVGAAPIVYYLIMTLGDYQVRKGIRVLEDITYMVTDKTLTSEGFAGVEDTDWENLVTTTI